MIGRIARALDALAFAAADLRRDARHGPGDDDDDDDDETPIGDPPDDDEGDWDEDDDDDEDEEPLQALTGQR